MFLFEKKFAYQEKLSKKPIPPSPWYQIVRPLSSMINYEKHLPPRNSFHYVNVMLFGCFSL